MKNNAKQKSKTNENVRIYVNFTKKEKEALKEYTLWQYERWEKTKEALGGNVRDLVLIGFLGFNAAFPIFAQLTITYKEVNGEKIEVEKLQGLESTLEEMAKFLKPNYRLDRLYRTAINMVDYVSTKWGFLRIGSQKTTSKKRRTDIMNQIREYFLNSAGCYPALKWSDGGYLVLGKQNPEKNAMCYINKNKKLKKEYFAKKINNPVQFLKEKYYAYQGYYERPYGLHLLMIIDGEFITSSHKDYDNAALRYIKANRKIKTKYDNQNEVNKLQPTQFLIKHYNAIKIDYFIAPQEEENNYKKFDIVDKQHIPSVEVAIKQFTEKEYITISWLLFFYVKGYRLLNQYQNEQFNNLFLQKLKS